jgi:hypothetical protein
MRIQSRIIALMGAFALLFALILWLLTSNRPGLFEPSRPAVTRTDACYEPDCRGIPARACTSGSSYCEGLAKPVEKTVCPPVNVNCGGGGGRGEDFSLGFYLKLILMLTVSITVSVILAVNIALRFIQEIRLPAIVIRVATSPGSDTPATIITAPGPSLPPGAPPVPLMGMLWPLLVFVGLLLVALLYIALGRLLG